MVRHRKRKASYKAGKKWMSGHARIERILRARGDLDEAHIKRLMRILRQELKPFPVEDKKLQRVVKRADMYLGRDGAVHRFFVLKGPGGEVRVSRSTVNDAARYILMDVSMRSDGTTYELGNTLSIKSDSDRLKFSTSLKRVLRKVGIDSEDLETYWSDRGMCVRWLGDVWR